MLNCNYQRVVRVVAGMVKAAGTTGKARTIIAGTGRFGGDGVAATIRWQSGEITEETILANA